VRSAHGRPAVHPSADRKAAVGVDLELVVLPATSCRWRTSGLSKVLAPQVAIESPDALAVCVRSPRAGAHLLRLGQFGGGVGARTGQISSVYPVLSALPAALVSLVQRYGRDFRLKPGARHCSSCRRNYFQQRALQRQQPRHRAVFECPSASSQVRPTSLWREKLCGHGDHSDAPGGPGGLRMRERAPARPHRSGFRVWRRSPGAGRTDWPLMIS
jgi:hypothetical protein